MQLYISVTDWSPAGLAGATPGSGTASPTDVDPAAAFWSALGDGHRRGLRAGEFLLASHWRRCSDDFPGKRIFYSILLMPTWWCRRWPLHVLMLSSRVVR
jgi:multiple sugar transport system permease protein